jgi:hypothetical protein
MIGIHVYPLLLPAMYEFCYQAAYELKHMLSTEGVAQWARDYHDPQLCELLLKVDGALLKEMDTSLLTIQHYTSAIESTPSAIQYVPTSELTEDMIENALYLDPKIIMHLDHKWQTPRNVESYLRECASQNAMVDIGFIRQDCYTVKSAILAVRLNKTAYSKLPNNLQNDAEIKRIHHKLHFYEIESTL